MQHTWFTKAHLYHLYPLGFCGAPQINNYSAAPEFRFQKILQLVPHLKQLGITTLLFGPVWESFSHGYDTKDFYWIDRRLGTNKDVQELFQTLKAHGFRIILDGVFNHVGRDFWAFKDVQENREQSRFCSWFTDLRFGMNNSCGDPFTYTGWNGHESLVKLNLQNPEVTQHLLGAVRMWIEEFAIDGLRLDAADCVALQFQKELARYCRQMKPDFFLLGEIIHGDYNNWANPETLDSVTNYECYKGLYSSHNDKNYFEIAYALNRQFGQYGMYKYLPLSTFADNHDVTRLASHLHHYSHIGLVYCLIYCMPGIPTLYYGSEFGITGIKEPHSDQSLRPCLDINQLYATGDNKLVQGITQLAEIRKSVSALVHGEYRQLFVSSQQFAFCRYDDHSVAVVLLNAAAETAAIPVKDWGFPGEFTDVADLHEIKYHLTGATTVTMQPYSYKILVRNL